jgi:hypothetical protein
VIIRVVFFAIAIFLVLNIISYLKRQSPAKRRQLLIKYSGYVVLGIVIMLAATGRLHWIGAVIAGILPFSRQIGSFIVRSLPFLKWIQQQRMNPSVLTTDKIKIVIDSKTGVWQGQIIEGEFSGKPLSDLTQEQLIELSHSYHKDSPDSARLLNAYMRYRFQQKSQNDSQQQASPTSNTITKKEALDILGLDDNAEEKDIRKAHRSLMQKVHPDRGGSDYLASKINQAKDFLVS